MTKSGAAPLIVLVLFVFSGCATLKNTDQDQPQTVAQNLIENYFAATNKRDLLMLTAYVTPDFEWISMVDGERVVEVNSREALAETLRQYFTQYAHSTVALEHLQVAGNFVAVNERSEWRDAKGEGYRTSLGIYELSDGRIRRVTYFLTR
ncbi:MAG: nuclear transport factor 2 family protein [Candidatus Obscuribacterales bacterium]|nr:nuclear transport factor 2 family protein [Steroidobacteraceae bacterium]